MNRKISTGGTSLGCLSVYGMGSAKREELVGQIRWRTEAQWTNWDTEETFLTAFKSLGVKERDLYGRGAEITDGCPSSDLKDFPRYAVPVIPVMLTCSVST